MSSTNAAELRREFVDSNVLIYSVDPSAGRKGERARALLAELWGRRSGCVSIQVLQEFYVTVTGKLPQRLSLTEGARKVADFAAWTLHQPAKDDLLSALEFHREAQISFWDAMIVHAARAINATVLYSEDLTHGASVGGVAVRNPFAVL